MTFDNVVSFDTTEGNGEISELGLANNSLTTYFSRYRLVDAEGIPTTITKDSSHLLLVTIRFTITRIGDPFAVTTIVENGNLNTTNNVVSFVNNQWIASFLARQPYRLYSGKAYASASDLSIASGIANKYNGDLTSDVYGTPIYTKVASGQNGDDWYIDLKIEIPASILNINIKAICFDQFMSVGVLSYASYSYDDGSLVCIFETPLPKTSSNKVYLTFRHTWTRS